MDNSVLGVDFSAWLSWTSDALFIADAALVLFVIVLVSCMVHETAKSVDRAHGAKRRAPLAH